MRTALEIHKTVIFAFFIRELRTRFGSGRLGYFWMLLSPLLQITLLSVLFGALGRHAMPGIEFPLFLITGMFAFHFFRHVSERSASSIDSNRALLAYRYVQPLDNIWARALLELLLFMIGFVGFLAGCAWLGYQVMPARPLEVIIAYSLLFTFSVGFGMITGVVSGLYPEMGKLLPLTNRPLIFISGVFFPLSVVPPQYREWLLWNPILHALELAREAYFPAFKPAGASWGYLVVSSGLFLLSGLVVYRMSRTRLLEND